MRVAARRAGHSFLEYVFILVSVALVAGLGAVLLGVQTVGALSGFTAVLPVPNAVPPTANRQTPPASSTAPDRQAGEIADPLPVARLVSRSAFIAAVSGSLFTLAILALLRVRRKQQAGDFGDKPLGEELVDPGLQLRLYGKRQKILRSLMLDSGLISENRIRVRHLMTPDLLAVSPNTTFDEMNALIEDNRVRHLLVCRKDGSVIGVVSDRDLRGRSGGTAQSLMTSPVRTVSPDTPLGTAISYLINEGISCLPAVENGHPCGVITTTDLVLTLQCTLQLWLRVAQAVYDDSVSAGEPTATSLTIDRSLAEEHTQLARLAERVSTLANTDRIVARDGFAHEAQDTLQTMSGLLDMITHTQEQVTEHAHRFMSLIDLHTDPLTGLGNRQGLDEMLEMTLSLQARSGQSFLLAILAIDRYEEIRSTYGKARTDLAVQKLAELVTANMRGNDSATRYSDNALALMLFRADLADACTLCERLRRTAETESVGDMPLTISVGVVCSQGDMDPTALLGRAETTLSHCTFTGGNCVYSHDGAEVRPAGDLELTAPV